jgi:hypothetical protein
LRPARRRFPERDGIAPEGVVGLRVSTMVEPVAGNLVGRRFDGGRAGQVGEGGFVEETLGVVPGGDDECASGVGAQQGVERDTGAGNTPWAYAWASAVGN